MPLNTGALALGLANTATNVMKTIPNIQKAQAYAELSGKQARQADWNQARAEEAYNGIRDTYKALGFSDAQIASMANLDTKQAQNLINNQEYARAFPMMQKYAEMAGLIPQGGATPQGVVQATQALRGQAVPVPDAPNTEPVSNIALDAPPPDVATQVAQNIARSTASLDELASANAKISGKNQFGNADQYGYQSNHLIGGGNVIDPTRAEEKHALNQATLAQKQASTANTKSIIARRAATPIRGSGGSHRRGRRGRKSSGSGGNGLFDVMKGVSKFVDTNRKADARDKRNMKYVGGTGGSARDED